MSHCTARVVLPQASAKCSALARLRAVGPLSLLNHRRWFLATAAVLEAHGVLSLVQFRQTPVILLPDASNRDAVQARDLDLALTLASVLIETHCGKAAKEHFVVLNPRATWRRLKAAYAGVHIRRGVDQMCAFVSCRYQVGEDLDGWLDKMDGMRRQLLDSSSGKPAMSDFGFRDVLLSNLPDSWLDDLDVSPTITTWRQVVKQLRSPDFQSPPLVVPFQPAPAPTPAIFSLPNEILHTILLLDTPDLTVNSFDYTETHVTALARQARLATLRVVCRRFAGSLGPPSHFTARNVTKIKQLTEHLRLYPARGRDITTLTLRIREPAHSRDRKAVLADVLAALFKQCPAVTQLRVGGVSMDRSDPYTAVDSASNRADVIFEAAKSLSGLHEFTLLGGHGSSSAHTDVVLHALSCWPSLRHFSFNGVRGLRREADPMTLINPIDLTSLTSFTSLKTELPYFPNPPSRVTPTFDFVDTLERAGALVHLRCLHIHQRNLPPSEYQRFTSTLLPIAGRLSSFTLTSTFEPDPATALLDGILPSLTSVRHLELVSQYYTKFDWLDLVLNTCRVLILTGPEREGMWDWRTLSRRLLALKADATRPHDTWVSFQTYRHENPATFFA